MEIRRRLYPYPVLAWFTDDYMDSHFDTIFDLRRDGYDFRLHCLSELNNDDLESMLTQDKVRFVYHVECAQTGFRKAFETNLSEIDYKIVENRIRGRVQVCSFIVAAEGLPHYSNRSLHDDYRGFTFHIDRGNIVAIGKEESFEIEKFPGDISQTRSAIVIVKNPDQEADGMLVDIYQRKLVVKIPEPEFYNYKSLSQEIGARSLLWSLIIVPALAHAMNEVVKKDPIERYELQRSAWYMALKKNLNTVFNRDLEGDDFIEEDMLMWAQKILKFPLHQALYTLVQDFGMLEGDDDE